MSHVRTEIAAATERRMIMSEYIERETAIAWFVPYAHAGESIDADVVISDIKGMKTADVAPVRHGRWERVIPSKSAAKWSTKVSCSNCHNAGYTRYKYCPNCGCRMDG